jgi:hypothetical protein
LYLTSVRSPWHHPAPPRPRVEKTRKCAISGAATACARLRDYLSIKTEEVIFGILFAFMAWKLWQSVRGLFRYWKYVRAPNAPETELEAGAIAFEEDDDENEKID